MHIFQLTHLPPGQNGRHFADDVFEYIFLNENIWISIKISPTFVHKGLINNIPALIQIMAWRRPGDKPLSEPMMFSLMTYICATRPQWVNTSMPEQIAYSQQTCSHASVDEYYNNLIQISQRLNPEFQIKNKSALVQVMAWVMAC